MANAFEVLGDCDDEGNLKLEVVKSDDNDKEEAPIHTGGEKRVICQKFLDGLCERGTQCPDIHPVTVRSLQLARVRKEMGKKPCFRDVFFEQCFEFRCPFWHADTAREAHLAAEEISEGIYRDRGSCKFAMLHFAGKGKKCFKDPWACRAHPQTKEQYERWRADFLVEQKKSTQCRLELTEKGCPHGENCNYKHSS
jgi:hypothetical protein